MALKTCKSISVSPNGWTDQELGFAWLQNDFDPATREKAAGKYRLLILDGHNSHCTFSFCKYAADNKIIIICLPSHTTHALQPCDVGAFGPLAQSWKRIVTLASQDLIAIRKDNLLEYYHTARTEAFKPTTIQSAFRKTGIWPLNPDAIPHSYFEPSKNTTTQAAQPLPAHLPSILVPTPTPTPIPTPVPTPTPSAATAAALHHDSDIPVEEPVNELPDEDEEPMERYHIEVPPPLPGTSSRQQLRAENMLLRDIIRQAGIALEEDYAQMKLMDMENERLRKRAFEKERRKKLNKLTSGHARHMTAEENINLLARQDWESRMKDILKEAAPRFKVLKKNILDYHKEIEKARKVAEREAKKAAAAAIRAERARGRGRGTRGGRRGVRRGARGRGAEPVREAGVGVDDSDSESTGTAELSERDSDSDSESEAEIPIPRSRRERPVRVIQGRHEGLAVREMDGESAARDEGNQRTERPRPRPLMRNHIPEIRDEGEVGTSGDIISTGERSEADLEQEEFGCEHDIGTKCDANLVPRMMEGGLGIQVEGIEVAPTMQSGDVEPQVGPSRRRNPRRGKQSKMEKT